MLFVSVVIGIGFVVFNILFVIALILAEKSIEKVREEEDRN